MFPAWASSVIESLDSAFASMLMMMFRMIRRMSVSCSCSLSDGTSDSVMISFILSSFAFIHSGSAAVMAMFTSGSTKVPKPRMLELADPTLMLSGRLSTFKNSPSVDNWIVPLMLRLFKVSVMVPAPEIRVDPKSPVVSCRPTILSCGILMWKPHLIRSSLMSRLSISSCCKPNTSASWMRKFKLKDKKLISVL